MQEIQENAKTNAKKYEKYLMFLNTVQGTSIKTLTEALHSILTDVNINFDEKGLSIMNIDPDQISFVSLVLDAENFEEFYCPNPLSVGVNMLALHRLLKTIGNNDTVSLYILKEASNELGIRIQNKKKRIDNEIFYSLIDVNELNIEIPEIDYDAEITIPCSDFQKYCRELSNISNYVTISTSAGNIFSMEVDGRFARQVLSIGESDENNIKIEMKGDSSSKIGQFSLKYLNLFCKSSSLCNTIQLYMKAEFPLVMVYSVASLGTCKFCLSPQIEESSL
jgi:proliferating cell nuclear antigen